MKAITAGDQRRTTSKPGFRAPSPSSIQPCLYHLFSHCSTETAAMIMERLMGPAPAHRRERLKCEATV